MTPATLFNSCSRSRAASAVGAGRHCPELNLTSAITTSDDGGPEYLAMTPISPSYAEPSRDRPSVKPARTLATQKAEDPAASRAGPLLLLPEDVLEADHGSCGSHEAAKRRQLAF